MSINKKKNYIDRKNEIYKKSDFTNSFRCIF